MASFLSPLLKFPERPLELWNNRSQSVLADRLEPAFDSKSRNRGLLGRQWLEKGAAMVLAPCASVHTCFMRFPIDVIFASRDGRVVKVYAAVPAWRIAFAFRAFAAIELPAGAAALSETRVGDLLVVVPSRQNQRLEAGLTGNS